MTKVAAETIRVGRVPYITPGVQSARCHSSHVIDFKPEDCYDSVGL